MIIDYEDSLYRGTVYRIIGSQGQEDEEYLYFAQPRDSKTKYQQMHDNALDELFEREEDLLVMKAELESNESEV